MSFPIAPLSSLRAAVLLALLCSACATRAAEDSSEEGGAHAPAAPDVGAFDGSTTFVTIDADDGPDAGFEAEAALDAPAADLGGPVLKDIGTVCAVSAECTTGSCVDGVCCSSAACGGCLACNVIGSQGACAPLPKFTEDDRSSCTGTLSCDGAGHCALYLGNYCKVGADCISGFCVDGMCCESACDQQCYACNQLGRRGKCTPTAGPDEQSSAPCSGARACLVSPTGQPSCLLTDGQTCAADADCVSGACRTFFADAEGDSSGAATRRIQICAAMATPPAEYTNRAGNCCDADGRPHPGAGDTFYASADACGSFGYDCSGYIEKLHAGTGPTRAGYPSGAAADCGKVCSAFILGSVAQLYTQECP